jgi:TPR repeat protein
MDRATAQNWFRAAAMLGHGQAQLMLGRYLRSGVAGDPNPQEAREWLERAVAQGVADAQHDLAELSPLPPPSDAEWTWRSDQVAAPRG